MDSIPIKALRELFAEREKDKDGKNRKTDNKIRLLYEERKAYGRI